jgi:hypothetical protein
MGLLFLSVDVFLQMTKYNCLQMLSCLCVYSVGANKLHPLVMCSVVVVVVVVIII